MALGGGTLISSLGSTTAAASYVATHAADPSGAANTLLVAWVVTTGAQVDPSSVTGHGLTFTQAQAVNRGTTIRLMCYIANGSGAATTPEVTVAYGANQTGQGIIVHEFTGVDTTTIGVGSGQAVVQAPTGTGTSGTGSVTMAAFAHADNRTAAAFEHGANEATTAETNWTGASVNYNTPAQSMGGEHELDSQDTTPTATWATTTGAWRGIAIELNALQASSISWEVGQIPF